MIAKCENCENNMLELLGEVRSALPAGFFIDVFFICPACGETTVFTGQVDEDRWLDATPAFSPYGNWN